MHTIKISTSILNANFLDLANEIKKIEAGKADSIHIDVMDGHFVPNITFGIPIFKAIRKITSLPLDVHLMVENPERHIESYIDSGADMITFHIEATNHAHRLIQKIKERGIKAGISLNPSTHHSTIEYLMDDLDMILLMTVNPGFGGQEFLDSMIPKIKALSNRGPEIAIDGGIGIHTAKKAASAGANILVAGTSVFSAKDPAEAIMAIRRAAR
jgi:ribulose-phosphate 3-epimerase